MILKIETLVCYKISEFASFDNTSELLSEVYEVKKSFKWKAQERPWICQTENLKVNLFFPVWKNIFKLIELICGAADSDTRPEFII